MRKRNKSGSYLVEAALILPIFILAVLMLMSSVPVLSASENAMFSLVDEMRLESVKSAFRKNATALPIKAKARLYKENRTITTVPVISCRYLYANQGIEDLFCVSYRFSCEGNDPFGLFRKATFTGKITARAFTGTVHRKTPFCQEQKEETVYIFPEWGMRYHEKNCTYVKGSCQMVYLSSETKKDYNPCNLCNAKSAQIGSPVFCFLRYGEVYHLDVCRQVKRYYITMDKGKAQNQGYTPCSKCGG